MTFGYFLKTNNLYKYLIALICFYILLQVFTAFTYIKGIQSFKNVTYLEELVLLNSIFRIFGYHALILDKKLISFLIGENYYICNHSMILLGMDSRYIKNNSLEKIVHVLDNFDVENSVFYEAKSSSEVMTKLPIAILLKKSCFYLLYILYTEEDNTWWYGNLMNDEHFELKFKAILPNYGGSYGEFHAGILDKFERIKLVEFGKHLSQFLLPKNVKKVVTDLDDSRFIECNKSRAYIFRKMYKTEFSVEAQKFKHRAWKLLSKAKTILDSLSVSFWISSGTCLGYFRECDIISYSKDVDIGIFAKDYHDKIIYNMQRHGLILKHWFGYVNDSLELSFIDTSGLKLDIFFFYEEENITWNGGTQLRTGKKYKYIFPKFDLCWTLFCNLKLRIPCQTESYIVANYGPNWFIPVKNWDWKSSPYNVLENGVWT